MQMIKKKNLSVSCELLTMEIKPHGYCALVVCLKSSIIKMGTCLTFVPKKEHNSVINSADLNVSSKHWAVKSL